MNEFPIAENLESALIHAKRCRRDAMGYLFYTFRVQLTDEDKNGHTVLSLLVDHGWQLQGGPFVVETSADSVRHVIITMFQAEPRPIRFGIEFRGGADIKGELQGD